MTSELETFIQEYRRCAEEQGNAFMEGDSVTANQNYDKRQELRQKIRDFGNEGDVALLSLMEDTNQNVKCLAAIDSLRFDKRKAVKVLKKLSKEKGIIAFNAKMFLKEWKKGAIEMP